MRGSVIVKTPLSLTLKFYVVGACVTVDKSLITFLSCCGLKQYMPDEPEKYR